MSRIEVAKLKKLLMILMLGFALYISMVSISESLWSHLSRNTMKTMRSTNFYLNFVESISDVKKEDTKDPIQLQPEQDDENDAVLDFKEPDDDDDGDPNYDEIQTLLLFIGYPRSGSTLLGSILDAHPNIVIANEYNLLGHWKNFSGQQKTKYYMFNELWQNSVKESRKLQRAQQNNFFFSYYVPGAWQGKYKGSIKVIGDKKCTSTTRNLARTNSTQYAEISRTIRKSIKFIHIVRNPFDNIATMTLRAGHPTLRRKAEEENLQFNSPTKLRRQMKIYFRLVDSNVRLRNKYGKNVLDVHYTSFIRQPKVWLQTICDFLEVYCSEKYLDSCVRIVFKKETYTRRHIVWPPEIKHAILNKIESVDFLKGLTFDIT